MWVQLCSCIRRVLGYYLYMSVHPQCHVKGCLCSWDSIVALCSVVNMGGCAGQATMMWFWDLQSEGAPEQQLRIQTTNRAGQEIDTVVAKKDLKPGRLAEHNPAAFAHHGALSCVALQDLCTPQQGVFALQHLRCCVSARPTASSIECPCCHT